MGLPVNDIIKPILPQAKVNKCLIALVSSKVVMKAQVGVSVLSIDSIRRVSSDQSFPGCLAIYFRWCNIAAVDLFASHTSK